MKKPPAAPLTSFHTQAVAEELAHLLAEEVWHTFEGLYTVVAEDLCPDENGEPCRELLRLHIYGRLKNWVQHGFLEHRGEEYRAVGGALVDLNNHIAAEHCRGLIQSIVAPARRPVTKSKE